MMNEAEREELEASIRAHLEAGESAQAITVAIKGYGPEILAFLVGTMRDENAASEVFSAFSEDLLRGIEGFAWRSSFRTWAYTLARHACSRYLRDPHRRRARRLATDEVAGIVDELRTGTPQHMKTEMKHALARIRQALSPEERMLLILHVDRGMSLKEAAEVMSSEGEPVRHVALRKRFQRVKEKIRRLASDLGLPSD